MTIVRTCSAHQPAFLPWLGTLHKVAISDVFIVMDLAKFRKRAFMHRNQIEINGAAHYVGIQVNGRADSQLCNEVAISEHSLDCMRSIAEKIEHTYQRYEFYSDVKDFVSTTLLGNLGKSLVAIYVAQLFYLCEKLRIGSKIILESEIMSVTETLELGASFRLREHALRTNSNIYVTGINSVNYLDDSIFKEKNILHLVQDFRYDQYRSLQTVGEPLSVVHQIAKMGFEGLASNIATNQTTKADLKTGWSAKEK